MPSPAKASRGSVANADTLREEARALLLRVIGFRDCAPGLLDELVGIGQLRHVRRGEYAVRRGDRHTHVLMLVRGLIESSTLRADGHRHLLGLALPGDFFALMSLSDGQPHSYDLCAREDCMLLSFPAESLKQLRAREPAIVLACERHVVHRTRLLFERLAADPGVALEARVAGMLRTLSVLYGRPSEAGVVLDVKLSQGDLADWLGLSRQRVNFALKQLENEGLIALRYSGLTITNPAGLDDKALK